MNIGMENLGDELNCGRMQRILARHHDIHFKATA